MDERDEGSGPTQTPGNKKSLIIRAVLGISAAIVLVGAGLGIRWYALQDHSIYSKLKTTHYSKNGVKFSFSYPAIMQNNPGIASKLVGAPEAYTYYANQNLQAVVAVSQANIGSTLQVLRLTPAQYISQIRHGSGSFITALNDMQHTSDSAQEDFPGCTQTVTTSSGQTAVLCVHDDAGHTYVRVIGATNSTQYTLEAIMRPAIWTAHPKVWQKVEKSFAFH